MKDKTKTFFENLMRKDFLKKTKRFHEKSDYHKHTLRFHRNDLFSFSLMTDDEREDREEKLFDLCCHFATGACDSDQENIFNFWPKYLNQFMTPKLFDLVPNEWFTEEIGFCFACKHFKGANKGHHKLFNTIKRRKVIGLFGICQKHKNIKLTNDQNDLIKFNHHVMPNYRCKGWEPSKFYSQLLRRRLYLLLTNKNSPYTLDDFNKEQDLVNICGFLGSSDIFYY